MMKLQLLLNKLMFLAADVIDKTNDKGVVEHWVGDINYGTTPKWVIQILVPIIDVLDSLLLPIIIILGTAGMIYGIVLGVQFAKAETADKREEAKKRMINAIIGIVIMLILLILAKVFTSNAPDIFQWVTDSASGNPTGGAGE